MLPLLVLLSTIAGAWYLLIVRPQRDQQTRHGRLVERLQVGDHVLTVGGIYGQVTDVTPTSVELRLGPGTTTRIATDGIARIVHESESSLSLGPEASQPNHPRDTVETMQHPPQHTQHAQPTQEATPSGFAPPPVPAFAPQPVAHAPVPGPMTLRAQVVPVAEPQYAPPLPAGFGQVAAPVGQVTAPAAPILAPWGDVAPVHHGASAQHAAPAARPLSSGFQLPPPPMLVQQAPAAAQHAAPQYAPQHVAPQHDAQHAMPQYAPQQGAPQYAPQPMVPQYAPQPHAPAQPVYAQPHAPVDYAPAPAALQATPAPGFAPGLAQAAPAQHAPAQYPHAAVQHAAPPAPPESLAGAPSAGPQAAGRRHSAAPQGMGSSLRLDDPSLTDTMVRARQERSGLAEEYRRAHAPMVDTTAQQAVVGAPQAVAYPVDPAGMYAAPQGMPQAIGHGHAPAYPAPARPMAHGEASAMPRPVVAMSDGPHDPAFQRRTPMTQSAPPVYPAPAVPQGTPAHA